MAALPGHAGMPIIGDKSIEFYKDVIQFANKRIEQHNSRIFLARFLNKPTVFVTSNSGVRQLLNEHHDKVELGYKAFMYQIYGDNIIFADGAEADGMRTVLKSLLTSHESIKHFRHIINRQTQKHLRRLQGGSTVAVYSMVKRLATEICLCIFLDINFEGSQELADQIVALTTIHWHGIISVPVNFKMGLSKSTYSKALDAKGRLLSIINTKLSENSPAFPTLLRDHGFSDAADVANHLLLFTSALVPKGLASLLTSFILATAGNTCLQTSLSSDPCLLEHTLHEVQRLWPPIVGGRRVSKQSFELCGYQIPANHAIVYLSHHAQRDPEVFEDPDSFRPERWINRSAADDDNLFLLGSGPRDCVGRHLVWDILTTVSQELSKQFTWQLEDAADAKLQYKWLPVARPKEDVKVIFKVKSHVSEPQAATESS